MSLKLEVQTEFAAGCNQEKEEEQAGGAKLGNFPTWLYWESFRAAPGLLCCPHCLSPEQHSESSLHWKEFSWSFIKWILVKIQSGSGKKKKSAFEALILLIGADKYKSHVFKPAATSHAFHLWEDWMLPGRREALPLVEHLCLRMVHQLRWNWAVEGHFKLEQVGIVGAGLVYLCDCQKGYFKRVGGSNGFPWLWNSGEAGVRTCWRNQLWWTS